MRSAAGLLVVYGVVGSVAAEPVEAPRPPGDFPPLAAAGLTVPPLSSSADAPGAPRSFVVDGVHRTSAKTGIGVRFAKDGGREFCAVYDVGDGTPIFLSDERQTLIYDLKEARIVLVPGCHASAFLRWEPEFLRWEPEEERPWRSGVGLVFTSSRGRPGKPEIRFEIDRFVADCRSRMRRRVGADGTQTFSFERRSGVVETVRLDPSDPSRLGFAHTEADAAGDAPTMELNVTHIGQAVPDEAFAFPDLAALERDIPLTRMKGTFLEPAGFLAS